MAKVLDAIRRAKENRKHVTVIYEGETIQLKRVDGATYQAIMQDVSKGTDRQGDAEYLLDFTARCYTHVIDGLDFEEAKDLVAACGGVNGDLSKAVMDACGLKSLELLDDLDEGDGGN